MTDLALAAAPPAMAGALCAHCGAPVGGAGRFCCAGCAAAWALVAELGLGQYHALRPPASAPPPAVDEIAADPSSYVATEPDGTRSLSLAIGGLRCPACAWLIETALAKQEGVLSARLVYATRRLRLTWRGGLERGGDFARLIRRLGYRPVPFDPKSLAAARGQEERALLRALAVAGFAAGNVMLLSVAVWAGNAGDMGAATRGLLHWVSALIALPAIAYAGRPFFASALRALRRGHTNIDVPIAVGVAIVALMSLYETAAGGRDAYFDSAAALLFFLLVGRYLDLRARGRARTGAEALLALGAQPVTRLDADGRARQMPAAALAVGDTLLVAAGERIGGDGEVLAGRSAVDRSLLDGETTPFPVRPGSPVHAGVGNLEAPLRIRVTATGERTLLAEIVRLLEAAEQRRARIVVLADRVARRYAPVVHLLALATLGFWLLAGRGWREALLAAVAVLIITCPCALALAVPVVQIIAGSRLLRRGILVKSATALERLAEVDAVVFDKTGTLTLATPSLDDGAIAGEAVAAASALAAASRHPLCKALRAAAPEAPAAAEVVEHPGEGLACGEVRLGSREFCGLGPAAEGEGPELWLSRPGHAPLRFGFRDTLRPDAAAVVAGLGAAGKRVLLLSGDRRASVARCAAAVGIGEWHAALSAADKARRLSDLAAAGERVLMVGDGLNDAPALAAAHASMSPASAADISQNAADIVFQGASLAAVGEALAVAGKGRRLVRQNLAIAIGYNLVAVPLAMAGLVTPLLAAVAMSASSLIVILNAFRLGLGAEPAR